MKTHRSLYTAALIVVLSGGAVVADCQPVAGTIDATVVGGEPLNVLGNVTGDLAGATRAVVLGQKASDDGSVTLELAHNFVTFNRGSLATTDSAVWTPVPGREGVFHMSTSYTITGGTGAYDGATGELVNDGVADTTTGLVTLRYAGEVCVD
ncbi:MAG: hypothetical protein NXH94_19040 [Rhodobacteraceae bacterium]|uniref:hypothetical protein n=1 Tax=Marivita sp. TaxID=2003365 RepID=UPI003B52847B|nr:hypothetical protein [Paracoccaceae bacterium]